MKIKTKSAMQIPSNKEKQKTWADYYAGTPTRPPLRWNTNTRVWLLDPALNTEGISYEQYFCDPQTTLLVQTRFAEYATTVLNTTCDYSTTLPETWSVYADIQNCTDALFFGGKISYASGQIPSVEPFLSIDDIEDFIKHDFCTDLEKNPLITMMTARQAALEAASKGFSYLGRPVRVGDFLPSTDGPVTACVSIFGTDFLLLLAEEPEKCKRLFEKMVRDLATRNHYLRKQAGLPAAGWRDLWFADDSVQLIGTDTFRETVLDSHKLYCDLMTASCTEAQRICCHLCGDATRHFPLIHETIGIDHFDTGFPVDHGALRKTLGNAVGISGGPHISILLEATPEQCYIETRRILDSGVCEGGRFILQEANNLPPLCPLDNLRAVYQALLDSSSA